MLEPSSSRPRAVSRYAVNFRRAVETAAADTVTFDASPVYLRSKIARFWLARWLPEARRGSGQGGGNGEGEARQRVPHPVGCGCAGEADCAGEEPGAALLLPLEDGLRVGARQVLRRRHGAAARSRRGTHPSPLPGSAPPDPRARASGARRLKEVAELLTFSSIIQRSLVVTYWDRCRQLTGGESAPSGFSLMALNDKRLPPAEQRHLHSPAATLNYSAFGRCLLTQERDHSRLPEITRDASSPRSAPAPRDAGHAAECRGWRSAALCR